MVLAAFAALVGLMIAPPLLEPVLVSVATHRNRPGLVLPAP
jgi:hypothetical protein